MQLRFLLPATAMIEVCMMIAITGSGLAGAATPSADSRAQAFLSPASASKPVQTGAASIESLPLTKAAPVLSQVRSDRGIRESGVTRRLVMAERWRSVTAPRGRQLRSSQAAVKCPSARKAVRYYRARYVYWLDKMGAGAGTPVAARLAETQDSCPRYLAHVLQRKAHAARVAYERWHRYQWEYQRWMPGWMIRLGQCEMSLDWSRQWGGYEGAFAFATGTWDQYRLPSHPSDAWRATPRQQMEVVYRVARAVTVGGAWGCWRGDQHAWVRGGLPESGFRG